MGSFLGSTLLGIGFWAVGAFGEWQGILGGIAIWAGTCAIFMD